MAVKVDLILNDGSFSAKIKQAAQGFVQMANAIKTAKNAQQAFNNVLKANPFGLITMAATEAGEALYNYVTGVYDAQRAQEQFSKVLKDTKQQLSTLADDANFDMAIAKASGASAMSLANMRVEAAKARLALADLTYDKVAAPDSLASAEQIAQAREMQRAAEVALNEANRARTVLDIQLLHGTGPYKHSGRGGGGGTIRELTEEQQNQQRINKLVQEYVTLKGKEATADNVERLAILQQEINLLQRRNQQLALYKEEAKGRMLPISVQMGNVPQGMSFASWQPTGSFRKEAAELKINPQEKAESVKTNQTLVDGISSIAGGIQQMGIELPEGLTKTLNVMQGISSILTGIAAIVSIIQATSAIIAGTSAVKAVPIIGFLLSGGGTVKGNNVVHAASGYTVPGKYGYDAVPAMLTSGETVLNAAQTNNLASQLQGGGLNNLNLSASFSAETIRMVLNNNGRRTGRGEYVQTNFR